MGRHAEQAQMLANRIRKNMRRLRAWRLRERVSCYRVYDRDIPELPFVIEVYEAQLHIAEFARPGSPQGAEHAPWLEAIVSAAAEATGVEPSRVSLKTRERQRGAAQYSRLKHRGERWPVSEGGLSFLVNLHDYLDTGLFLDHRTTRAIVREAAAGTRFLNLFAYTGSFSVYAAAGGARRTTTVDMSATYCQWARDNLSLNGFTKDGHRVIQNDVAEFLANAPSRAWDLVVVDPPTFSNSKRMRDHFDVGRDHVGLLSAVIRVTAPGGLIYFSTNARRFQLNEGALERAGVRELEEITPGSIAPDFRNQKVHRCWRLVAGLRG